MFHSTDKLNHRFTSTNLGVQDWNYFVQKQFFYSKMHFKQGKFKFFKSTQNTDTWRPNLTYSYLSKILSYFYFYWLFDFLGIVKDQLIDIGTTCQKNLIF
jgi:hypothetical protein